jgi:hypothetical protein
VSLSPILPGSAAWRPNAGGWVNIALPRLPKALQAVVRAIGCNLQ